ncbi:MAG: DUF4260 domain-containing protein [Acidobacteriaceae bacterium]|jgi:hypothetical protein
MLTRPALLLRLEEASLLVAALLLYAHLHFSWPLFAALFLAPDLFMLGYLANPKIGAATYNLAHVLFLPLALFALAHAASPPLLAAISIIWFSHIALDRLLGYGLKYPARFQDTHLQHIP